MFELNIVCGSFRVENQLPLGWKDVIESFIWAFYWILNDGFEWNIHTATTYTSAPGSLRSKAQVHRDLFRWWPAAEILELNLSWCFDMEAIVIDIQGASKAVHFHPSTSDRVLRVSTNQWNRKISMIANRHHDNHSRLLTWIACQDDFSQRHGR